MTHEVFLAEKAVRQLKTSARWWAENRSAEQAEKWYLAFLQAMDSLGENPERCQIAPESKEFPIEMRQLSFGLGRRTTHRAVFAVRPDRVVVYAIRHHAQAELTPDDL